MKVLIVFSTTGRKKVKKVKFTKKYTLNCRYLLDILFWSNSFANNKITRIKKNNTDFEKETLLEK
tara:strand:- start:2 stop:196 length:195 start_codon:yes stop_codon:yes gene_type:complete